MKTKILTRLNVAIGAMIVGLTGTTLTSCMVKYGSVYVEDPGTEPIDTAIRLMYGVPSANWSPIDQSAEIPQTEENE